MDLSKNIENDRILILKVIDDKLPKTSHGMVDQRLFKGDNKLHVIFDGQTTLWNLKYDSGVLPEPLQQKFTSFKVLKNFVAEYFRNRNIEIAEVVNASTA